MDHPRLAAVTAAIVLLTHVSVSAESGRADVRVRVYDNAGVPDGELRGALAATRAVLSAVAVDIDWRDCSTPGASTACNGSLAPGELALRVTRMPVPHGYAGRLPLGDALIDGSSGKGVLATIYYDRVAWLAEASATPVMQLLARAMAHEIAHLLIGSHRHDEKGLMRPVWRREDLERNRAEDWELTAADAAAIRSHRGNGTASVQ